MNISILLLIIITSIIISSITCSFFLVKKNNEYKKIFKIKTEEIEILQKNIQKEIISRITLEEKYKFLKYVEFEMKIKSKELKILYENNSELKSKLAKNIEFSKQIQLNVNKRLEDIKEDHKKLINSFTTLSGKALLKNNEAFLSIAKLTFEKWQTISNSELEKKEIAINEFLIPLRITLEKMDEKNLELEVSRKGAYSSMRQQIISLIETQKLLQKETNNLNKALHSPISRGRWGEMQLKRVVELAGMMPYCDFEEQSTILSNGKEYRPDLIIKLPGNRNLVIDAKMPLDSYLKFIEAKDELSKKKFILAHTEQIKRHINLLSKKSYWKKINPTPEFVVLFLPGEAFFAKALEQNPKIVEFGVEQGVIVATPTILIALLKAIAYGWKQELLSQNALKITQLAQVLCERIDKIIHYFYKLGCSIDSTVNVYNQTLGSLESRVLSTAKKLEKLGQKSDIMKKNTLSTIDQMTRTPRIISKNKLNN